MTHTAISPPHAPAAVGPYSPGIVCDCAKLVFVSGQVALDPASGQMVAGGINEQTRRVLENIRAILQTAGSGMDRVVKTTVFLADMNDFAAMNEVYAGFFPGVKPARSTVQVARLPKDATVEIEAVGLL